MSRTPAGTEKDPASLSPWFSLEENRELRIVAVDFGRIKAVVGSEQVNAVINRAKQQEQIEGEQKRAARRKHNREAR